MKDILDELPDGVVVVGPDRCVAEMNRAAERLTGWTRQRAVGLFYGDVVRLRDAAGKLVHERADPFTVATPLASGTPEREYMLHRADGGERWVAVRTSFGWGPDRTLVKLIATLRDISRRHRVERSAYDLIATLAHDLRSPLTSVKGFTSTLLRKWDLFDDAQKQHMLHTVNWDADRMHRLLTDLLDLSRLEAGRLELKREEFDLAALVKQIVERIAIDHMKTHTIAAEFPPDFPVVFADQGKVEQVITNLVENAVKHGDPGKIVVSGDIGGPHVTLRVEDSGPGIPERHRPYVFTKFYRKGTGERHAGTGLGLYIAKGIIETHGGEICIERSDDTGTVFAFTLPVSPL